ncbi:hypothetical protein GWK41_02285 [Persephonella atlantica]|uniref:Uncharacterized protein n=1 Tax=Persephonella atlantica TaxID=2699429 RepID=A0ABS1GG87_9AQUI|nr:hypothetical protein [Persephonella atlantica]MBK3331895.1 hypothetical protein [Persephonella atlantica]
MKYKVSKEELDALFREVYSSSIYEEDISRKNLTPTKEHLFLAYKYKNIIKRYMVSTLPLKIKLKRFSCYTGKDIETDNLFIAGYDVEKKFRVYVTVNTNFEETVNRKFSTGINSILDRDFNVQSFVELLSEHLITELKKDFPYSYKRINSPVLQFYEDDFVKLEYIYSVDGDEGEVSVWIEKVLLESEDISPIITSPPTTVGKKKIKKLLSMINVQYIIESEVIDIPVNKLKIGSELSIDLKLKEVIGGGD